MASTGNRLKPKAIKEMAFGDLTTSFQALGTPLDSDSRNVTFTNWTDVPVYFNLNDTDENQKKFPPFTSRIMDQKTNEGFYASGTQIYVKSVGTPTEGWVSFDWESA